MLIALKLPVLYEIIILLLILLPCFLGYFSGRKKRQRIIDSINKLAPDVEEALRYISSFYNYGHYITESERTELNDIYEGLFKRVSALIKSRELKKSPKKGA